MQIQRVTSLLQGIADVRHWLVEHIPLTSSVAGYDLFLKIANDFVAGRPLELQALLKELRHSEKVILGQIAKMEQDGLLVAQQAGLDPRARRLLPTKKFVSLLNSYSSKFETMFILRKSLRDQQLLVVIDDPQLSHLAASLYDHFYDLGWFYLHNFGAACFLMASLVKRVASAYGHEARIASCYVEIASPTSRYMLGAEGFAQPGQIDGHAVCIVDEAMIIDFGLGNVRKGYRRDFPWAIACVAQQQGPLLGGISLPTGETVLWKNDWQSPGSEAEIARYAPHIEDLYGQYEAVFR
jgi:hypothetical protein